MDAFINSISSLEEKNFIYQYRAVIEEIWEKSECDSLRILRSLINDIARFRAALNDKYLKDTPSVKVVLQFFSALIIEVKMGMLNETHLSNMLSCYTSERFLKDKSFENQKITRICQKYLPVKLTESILNGDILISMLIHGRFNEADLSACLDQSYLYALPSELPPWRVVLNFLETDDITLQDGLQRMNYQFENRSVTNLGEFLHIAALRLLMCEYKIFNHTLEEESKFLREYIDDLIITRRFPINNQGKLKSIVSDENLSKTNYGGYGYYLTEITKAYFNNLYDYIIGTEKRALLANYPLYAKNIMQLMMEESSEFYDRLVFTQSNSNDYYNLPIMKDIPAKDFLEAWLNTSRSFWNKVTTTLNNRYHQQFVETNLNLEYPWLLELENEMDIAINSLTGFDVIRLIQIKPSKAFSKARKEVKKLNDL